MRTIKVNIRRERQRYESLVHAVKNGTEIEGGYVVVYDEYTEAGETIVKFFLRDANDKAPYFLLASDREG